jgi:hypothetical protein
VSTQPRDRQQGGAAHGRGDRPAYLDDATIDLITQRTKPIPLLSDARVFAFHQANAEAPASEACTAARTFSPERRG